VRAPEVLVSFVPIACVALGFRYLNRADPDAGITFAWVTRAMGPQLGWINGWAIFVADVIVMAAVSAIAGKYTFLLIGWTWAAGSNAAQVVAAVVWIVVMTGIAYRGIEVSVRLQRLLLGTELTVLCVFALVALIKVYAGHPPGSITPRLDWLNPFALKPAALLDGVLLAVFIYWGWDCSLSVAEESRDPHEGPGRAAILSTVMPVVLFVLVATAGQAYGGTQLLTAHPSDVLGVLGTKVFGSPFNKLLILSVLTSAAAGTQLTILPTARATLSMARWQAIPAVFGRVHPRFMTPSFSTLVMGGLSIVWTVALLGLNPSQNVLGDTITALGFEVCFYYGFTGIACAVYYRRAALHSARSLVLRCLLPLAGGLAMFAIGVKACDYYSKAGVNYSKPLFGIQTPILVGIGGLLIGVVLMLICWPLCSGYFHRRPEAAAAGTESIPGAAAPQAAAAG
jgi:amino acid transporter